MLLLQIVPSDFQRFAEALEVYDFPFPQEAQRCQNGGVIGQVDEVFIGAAGFLLCCTFASATFFLLNEIKRVG